jgi:hypothetical protein
VIKKPWKCQRFGGIVIAAELLGTMGWWARRGLNPQPPA